MKTYLIDARELLTKLDDYLKNPEELPVLTVGTVKGMVKDCRMKLSLDIDWEEDAQYSMLFSVKGFDKEEI